MRAPRDAPSWPQRLTARQPLVLVCFNGVIAAWWVYLGVDDVRSGEPGWDAEMSFVLAAGFLLVLARMLWVRARVRAWDEQHPGEAPLGPTPAEARRARRTRLLAWWAASVIAVAAVVVAVLATHGSARGGLIAAAIAVGVVVVIDVLRSDRPAESVAPDPVSTET